MEKEKKNLNLKIIALIIVIVLIIVVAVVGDNGSSYQTLTETGIITQQEQKAEEVQIGGIVENDYIKMTLDKFEIETEYKFQYQEPLSIGGTYTKNASIEGKSGMKLVCLRGKITNKTSNEVYTSNNFVKGEMIINANTYKTKLDCFDTEHAQRYMTVTSQQETEYFLYAEVPENVANNIQSCTINFGCAKELDSTKTVIAQTISDLDYKYTVSNTNSNNGNTTNNESTNTNTSTDNNENVVKKEYLEGHEISGYIEILKTNLNIPILSEATSSALNLSVAIMCGTGLNNIGNNVIFGYTHYIEDKDKFFSDNSKLSIGDIIYITDQTKNKVDYEIYDIKKLKSNDTSYYERDTKGEKEITLVTNNNDTENNRLVIFAKRK